MPVELITALDRAQMARDTGVSEDAVAKIVAATEAKFRADPLNALHPQPREVQRIIAEKGAKIYKEAAENHMGLTRYLETMDPSERHKDDLDAFERQLMLHGIRPKASYQHQVRASTVEEFCSGKTRAEIIGGDASNRVYMSDQPASIVLFPEYINRQLRVTGQILPSILGDLVAITTGIDSAIYDTFYLNLDVTQLSLRRVGEGSEFATAELTGAQHSIRLQKYGRRLVGSYETFRRMSLDKFAFHLQMMAVQAAVDKSQRALDVIINGDGNAATAATNYNQTTLQGGVSTDPLSLAGWLAFNLKFKDPYKISTIIAQDASMIKLLLLNMGTFNIPFAQFRQVQQGMGGDFAPAEPFNMGNGMTLYARSFAPANTLVAIDNSRCLEMVTELGADIVETEKIISRQLNEIVVSEVLGFAILDPLANKTLTLGA